MTKKPYTWVKQKDIQMVHALRDAGLKVGKVAEITGRSPNTIKAMFEAKDLNDYHAIMSATADKYREPKEDPNTDTQSHEDTVKALYDADIKTFAVQMAGVIALLKSIDSNLTKIASALEKKKHWWN